MWLIEKPIIAEAAMYINDQNKKMKADSPTINIKFCIFLLHFCKKVISQ